MTDLDLECQVACQRLVTASYSLMDHGQYPETAALFAADGTWVRAGKPCTGREAILDALNLRKPKDVSRHFITNVHVTRTSEDTAEATALFTVARGAREGDRPVTLAAPTMIGDLFYKFRREDGCWLITHLQPRAVFQS